MDIDALLEGMAAGAQEVGAQVERAAVPAPANTLAGLKATFKAVDGPAAAALRERLEPLAPGAVWADEFGDLSGLGGEAWVVDAVDGAVQFLQGLPQWCVSVTLVRDGLAVAAVLHAPWLGETYAAAAGRGAWRNGSAVTPSAKSRLEAAVVATSQPPFAAAQEGVAQRAGASLAAVVPRVAAVRSLGPTSWQVADVGAGRLDAFWQCGRDDTNLLAGALIAAEAGATVTDLEGRPWRVGGDGILAAGPGVHGQLLDVLTAAREQSALPARASGRIARQDCPA